VSWTQANGYFITTGMPPLPGPWVNRSGIENQMLTLSSYLALLCFNWASKGINEGLGKYVLAALLATQIGTGAAYFKKGIYPPSLVYWTASLLMGIAALKGQ
jgi:hypothetical protein